MAMGKNLAHAANVPSKSVLKAGKSSRVLGWGTLFDAGCLILKSMAPLSALMSTLCLGTGMTCFSH